jgi:hypothetical protein
MRIFAAAIILAWAGASAAISAGIANAADSVVTELVTDRCTVTLIETDDEAGEPLASSPGWMVSPMRTR